MSDFGRGGWNKCKRVISDYKFIDSYLHNKEDITYIKLYYKQTGIELCRVHFRAVPNNFGGTRKYFICPICGRCCRYLYYIGNGIACRICANLNYPSQQTRKMAWEDYADKVERLTVSYQKAIKEIERIKAKSGKAR